MRGAPLRSIMRCTTGQRRDGAACGGHVVAHTCASDGLIIGPHPSAGYTDPGYELRHQGFFLFNNAFNDWPQVGLLGCTNAAAKLCRRHIACTLLLSLPLTPGSKCLTHLCANGSI